jgi:hypothetical protein
MRLTVFNGADVISVHFVIGIRDLQQKKTENNSVPRNGRNERSRRQQIFVSDERGNEIKLNVLVSLISICTKALHKDCEVVSIFLIQVCASDFFF